MVKTNDKNFVILNFKCSFWSQYLYNQKPNKPNGKESKDKMLKMRPILSRSIDLRA